MICASTGNTSASAAAYAAGLKAIVVIPEGKIALGKLRKRSCMVQKLSQLKVTSMKH